MRGSNQLVGARAAKPPRRQLSLIGPARAAVVPYAWGPAPPGLPRLPGYPRPSERASSCQGSRSRAGPRPEAGRSVSLGEDQCGSPPPTLWALRSPPRRAAHPPSSPATVAGPSRAPPPCWLLFPFPEFVASGPSANQDSKLGVFPANGIPAQGVGWGG